MSSPLPPDPYVALGVSQDAEAALIKTTYRKLALRCHPDKVTDESKKAQAADQFHRIQQAYEIIGDEDKRSRYDAQVKLAQLRRDVMERQGSSAPRVDVRTASYEMPTASPGRTAFSSRGPERVYEERRPSKQYDSDHDYFGDQRSSSRKNDDYERSKKSSPRDDKDRYRVYDRDSKKNERVNRTDKARSRDQETRRERDRKVYVDNDSESDESTTRARNESARRKEEERERERYRAAQQTSRQKEQSSQDFGDDRPRKSYVEKDLDARNYIGQAENRRPPPPPLSRSTSASVREYVDLSRDRPAYVRHSSAKTKTYERESSSSQPSSRRDRDRDRDRDRERKLSVPEVDDYADSRDFRDSRNGRDGRDTRDRRAPPPLQTTNSAPGSIEVPRGMPTRASTLPNDFENRDDPPPPPHLRRSETMPNNPAGGRRRDNSAPIRPSGLRQTEYPNGMPTPSATPDWSPNVKKYRYPSATGIPEEDHDYKPSPRTEIREPSDRERDRPRQPAPLRTTSLQSPYIPVSESPTSYYQSSPSRRDAPEYDRGYSRGFGEISGKQSYDYTPTDRDRESARYRRSPLEAEKAQYPKESRPDSFRMNSGYSVRRSAPATRPSMSRTASSVH